VVTLQHQATSPTFRIIQHLAGPIDGAGNPRIDESPTDDA
jgi:hypothetical protein